MEVPVLKNILATNDAIAEANAKLFKEKGLAVLNFMSSPGAGKTTLVIKTLEAAKKAGIPLAVIDGDIASTVDTDRVAAHGVPAVQINTGGACHLDASMISKALDKIDLDSIKLLIIENVGNLVCPAEFKLGEHKKVMLLSVTEGDDKPHKYPLMFSEADALVVNKIDLLAFTDFNMDEFEKTIRSMNPDVDMFVVSCTTGGGLDAWEEWVIRQVGELAGT
ncbi:MAG: hydrogenase nickel incorporation protein HypB [Actinomycetota bacterium]